MRHFSRFIRLSTTVIMVSLCLELPAYAGFVEDLQAVGDKVAEGADTVAVGVAHTADDVAKGVVTNRTAELQGESVAYGYVDLANGQRATCFKDVDSAMISNGPISYLTQGSAAAVMLTTRSGVPALGTCKYLMEHNLLTMVHLPQKNNVKNTQPIQRPSVDDDFAKIQAENARNLVLAKREAEMAKREEALAKREAEATKRRQ